MPQTHPAIKVFMDAVFNAKSARSTMPGGSPGPTPETVSRLSLGYQNVDADKGGKREGIELIPVLVDGKPMIQVRRESL